MWRNGRKIDSIPNISNSTIPTKRSPPIKVKSVLVVHAYTVKAITIAAVKATAAITSLGE